MVQLSVNVNKVATLRNSRGGEVPSVIEAVRRRASTPARRGITVHPRADAAAHHRRATCAISPRCWRRAADDGRVQHRGRSAARSAGPGRTTCGPHQCTLVPVQAGRDHQPGRLAAGHAARRRWRRDRRRCSGAGIRVSLFVDPDPRGALGARARRRSRRALHRAVRARVRTRRRRRRRQLRRVRRRRASAPTRSASASTPGTTSICEPAAVPHAAAPGRGVDRPRPDQPRALRRARRARCGSTWRRSRSTGEPRRARAGPAGGARCRAAAAPRRARADRASCAPPTARRSPARSTRRRRGRRRRSCSCTCSRARRTTGAGSPSGCRPPARRAWPSTCGDTAVRPAAAPSAAMALDVQAAVDWLSARPRRARPARDRPRRRVVRRHARRSLAAGFAAVRGVALISPSLDYRGVRLDAGVRKVRAAGRCCWWPARRIPYALRTVRALTEDEAAGRELRLSHRARPRHALLAAIPT